MIVADVEEALGIATEITAVPEDQLTAGARCLGEKKLPLPWDVLVHAWFDLSPDMPPAVVHRDFFGHDGAFRAGPPDAEFDRRFGALARTTDPEQARELAEDADHYCFEQSGALFRCAPQALYAVNRHVDFKAYRATFELADTEVDPAHWSRRDDGGSAQA
jgi:hypothetical protein